MGSEMCIRDREGGGSSSKAALQGTGVAIPVESGFDALAEWKAGGTGVDVAGEVLGGAGTNVPSAGIAAIKAARNRSVGDEAAQEAAIKEELIKQATERGYQESDIDMLLDKGLDTEAEIDRRAGKLSFNPEAIRNYLRGTGKKDIKNKVAELIRHEVVAHGGLVAWFKTGKGNKTLGGIIDGLDGYIDAFDTANKGRIDAWLQNTERGQIYAKELKGQRRRQVEEYIAIQIAEGLNTGPIRNILSKLKLLFKRATNVNFSESELRDILRQIQSDQKAGRLAPTTLGPEGDTLASKQPGDPDLTEQEERKKVPQKWRELETSELETLMEANRAKDNPIWQARAQELESRQETSPPDLEAGSMEAYQQAVAERQAAQDKMDEILGGIDDAVVDTVRSTDPTKKLVEPKVVEDTLFSKQAKDMTDKEKLGRDVGYDVSRFGYKTIVGQPDEVEIDIEQDIAVLQYTGGTTGRSKGAMLTQANLSANISQMLSWFPGLRPGEEKIVGVLPLFHVFAMTAVMNFAVASGTEMILLPRFELDQTLKTLSAKKATLFPAVPTIYTAINQAPDLAKYDLSSIRYCMSGGAPLPLEVKRQFEQITGCRLVEGYGLSESSPVATCNSMSGTNKENSIGLPVPGTDITIHDLEAPHDLMPVGERGEVWIKGPQIMKGYLNQAEETTDTLRDGWLRTGDVGYMDDQGHFFLVDRLKDLILCSGYNVYPRMVEEAIYLHSAVSEVTVIGIKDEYRGESPKAFVKLKPNESLNETDLKQFLEDKLSKIEMPSHIEFRDELPKTIIGKLSKKELVAEEQAQQA